MDREIGRATKENDQERWIEIKGEKRRRQETQGRPRSRRLWRVSKIPPNTLPPF